MKSVPTRAIPALLLALCIPAQALAQTEPSDPITAAELQAHVDYLASDLLEGRGAGTRGAELAAAFVAAQFQALGLVAVGDGWQQRFDLSGGGRPGVAAIEVGGMRFDGATLVRAARFSATGTVRGRLVAEDGEIDGNLVLVDGWEGRRAARDRARELIGEGAAGVCFLTGDRWLGDVAGSRAPATPGLEPAGQGRGLDDLPEEIRAQILEKLESMGIDPEALGTAQIRVAGSGEVDEAGGIPTMPSGMFGGGGASLEVPVLRVSALVGEALRAAAAQGEELVLTIGSERKNWSTNVLGVLVGSDPDLRSEYVVVGGHYDHLGTDGEDRTWNGADDNASGTAAVLEIAEALASLPTRPRRSVLFAAWGAEERGLVGSSAFVRDGPVPVDSIVAYVNLDMIARNDPDSIGVLHASSDLLGWAAEAAERVGIETRAQPSFFLNASDSGPFVGREVPTLFLFAGMHGDYHQTSDDPDTIDADKAARVARVALWVVRRAADASERPRFARPGSAGELPDPEQGAEEGGDEEPVGEPGVEEIGARVQELMTEGKSVEEIQKIIQKEFGVQVQIRIGTP